MRYVLIMRLLFCLFLWFLPQLALAAAGGAGATSPAGEVQLLQAGPLQNGQVPLALEFTLKPGWHIYSDPPGDAGFAPRVNAPAPVVLSKLAFPPAQTLVEDGLKSNVLTGHVRLPFTATHVSDDNLQLKASWLACASQCVPGQAILTLNIDAGKPQAGTAAGPKLWPLWLLAVVGGVVLNLMPCVFPILAMKAVAFAKLGGAEHQHIRREALAYTAGVVLSMLVLGGVLLVMRAAGKAALWGFQFHMPFFVAVMAWVLLAVGLSFAGLLRVEVPVFVQRLPAQNSFLTGLLAVLVAAPCTAPFMGVAIAAALVMPVVPALTLFLALGFGMALPILALGFVPHLAAALPRPGRWMVWMQRALSLPMFASFLWLGWVLFRQSGAIGVAVLLLGALFLLVVGLVRRPIWGLAVLALLPFVHQAPARAPLLLPGAQPYSPQLLATLRAQHHPVFIDLTAAWCITCQINERTTLTSSEVESVFKVEGVAVLVGDWTDRSPEITSLLRRYHHAGVPLYLYYPPDGPVQVLPQILTPQRVEDALEGKES